MALKLTIERLSALTSTSPDEIVNQLKERGVEVSVDDELTKEQIDIIKESIKKRTTVSVQQSTTGPKKSKNQITITRKSSTVNKTKLTLSPAINKKPIAPKKVSPPVQKDEIVEPDIEEVVNLPETPPPTLAVKTIDTNVKSFQIGAETSLAELAEKTCVSETELTQVFFNNGYIIKKNDPIDFDTAALLLETLGIALELQEETAKPIIISEAEHTGQKTTKPPVVTIMGHVDHGKTSLLDYIRSTKVAAKESGGITQHIGAYQVQTTRGVVTFLDTPGHEAFSAMRGRGANLTDIIVLIIAANDGIKPQTLESIQHAKATETPIIVALTKMDIAETGSVDRVLGELASHEVVAESWGGEVPVAQISSKTGEGVDGLLELISLQAELLELQAYAEGQISARVCEARIDRGRGSVITLIVESGTLKKGDILAVGPGFGKVRTLLDSNLKPLKSAKPSTPVEITGISPLPKAGDVVRSYPDEKSARQAAEAFLIENSGQKSKHALTLDELFNQHTDKLKLSVIIKADTHGSLEAISEILNSIQIDDTELNIIDGQVGSVNSSDVNLAASTGAELIAFHVNIESTAKKQLDQHNIQAQQFKIIYQLVDYVTDKIVRLKGPVMKEVNIGHAQVKAVFKSSKFGQIAGCGVTEGIMKRGKMARITRKGETIYEGEISSVKREKETLEEARKGTECGLGLKNFAEAKVGDLIECYNLEEDV